MGDLQKDFLDLFFPMDMREAKVLEFINLSQGGMSFHEYSLEFTKLSKYAPSLVSNPRETREEKVVEFINLRQGERSVHE